MKILENVADLLDYPGPHFTQRARDAISLLDPGDRKGSALLEGFGDFIKNHPISVVEEIYTSTFDLQPVCSLHMGHHLFGEGPQRGLFMAGLKEHYKLFGFSPGNELPDHLGVVLRYISSREAAEWEMVQECVIPALKKMLENFKKGVNPYSNVLKFLLFYLEKDVASAPTVSDGCCSPKEF